MFPDFLFLAHEPQRLTPFFSSPQRSHCRLRICFRRNVNDYAGTSNYFYFRPNIPVYIRVRVNKYHVNITVMNKKH